jgi:transmembrane sensor
VSVRAVGTAFAVRALTDEVTVTVTEGIVEVTRPQEPQATPQRVSANYRAEIHRQRGVTVRAEDPAEAGRQLSWREGVLSFSGESLAEAVREVNRYSRRQVEVADPELANKPVIGIFRAGDVDAFAQSTAVALGAEARVDGQVIRLVAPAGH